MGGEYLKLILVIARIPLIGSFDDLAEKEEISTFRSVPKLRGRNGMRK